MSNLRIGPKLLEALNKEIARCKDAIKEVDESQYTKYPSVFTHQYLMSKIVSLTVLDYCENNLKHINSNEQKFAENYFNHYINKVSRIRFDQSPQYMFEQECRLKADRRMTELYLPYLSEESARMFKKLIGRI